MRHGKYPFIIGFLVVPVALYAIFVVWAYIQAFYLSVYEWSGLGPVENFVGLGNFRKMWDDTLFWQSIKHNVFLLIFLPIITVILALVFALDRKSTRLNSSH